MDQVSRPYQFALVAVVVLAVVWMFVLKPGDDDAVAPLPAANAPAASAPGATAPGVTGLGNAVDGAQGAASAADESVAAAQAAAGQVAPATPPVATPPAAAPVPTPGAPVPAPTAEPGTPSTTPPAAKDPSRLVLDALDKGKVAVVLFHESRGSDDRAVHRAVRSVSRRSGRVVVHSIPVGDVGRYGAITRGVKVLSAPTVLVIGADRRARALTGLTDRGEVDQLVTDVLAEQAAARAAVPSR